MSTWPESSREDNSNAENWLDAGHHTPSQSTFPFNLKQYQSLNPSNIIIYKGIHETRSFGLYIIIFYTAQRATSNSSLAIYSKQYRI